MESRVGRFAAHLGEACALAGALLLPVFFNPSGELIFEEQKAALVGSLGLVFAAAWAVRFLDGSGKRGARSPIFLPWCAVAATLLLSTLASVLPALSFWGAPTRPFGAYTELCVMAFCLGAAAFGREGAGRFIDAALAGSIPVALYAILQRLGLDPMPWGADASVRAMGMSGSPILCGAFLAMTAPLALARGVEAARRALRGEGRGGAAWSGALYFVLFSMQVAALLATGSRGPLLGLLAGATLTILLILPARPRRILLGLVAASALAALLLTARTPEAGPPGSAQKTLGRFAELLDMGSATARERILIWRGVTSLLASNPVHLVLGWGPETLPVVFPPHAPPELAPHLRALRLDRAHNDTLDTLVRTGFLGLAARLAFLGVTLFIAFRACGNLGKRGRGRLFGASLGGGAALGALVSVAFGRPEFLGLGVAGGFMTAVFLWAAFGAPEDGRARTGVAAFLAAGCAGAVSAHFTEAQFGLADVTTAFLFWALAGCAAALSPASESREEPAFEPPIHAGALAGVLAAFPLCALAFGFLTPHAPIRATWPVLAGLAAATWVMGAAFLSGFRRGAIPGVLGWSALIAGAYATVHLLWLGHAPSGEVTPERFVSIVGHHAAAVSVFFAWVLALAGFAAALLSERGPAPESLVFRRRLALLYPFVPLCAVAVAAVTNLTIARADVLSREAAYHEAAGNRLQGLLLLRRAAELRPKDSRILTHLAEGLFAAAQGDPARRAALMEEALSDLTRALAANPLDADTRGALGKLHHALARDAAGDEAARRNQLALANGFLTEALNLNPLSAALWTDRAALAFDAGATAEGLSALGRATTLDPGYPQAFVLLGAAQAALGDLMAAQKAYERAAELVPGDVDVLRGLADACARTGERSCAISALERLLSVRPGDVEALAGLDALRRAGN